jgi:hypothetical protein
MENGFQNINNKSRNMNFKFNFLLAASLLICSSAFSQITGGGAGSGEPSGTRKAPSEDKGVFDNAFYLRAGFSIPVGLFGQKPSLNTPILAIYNGEDGMGAVTGGTMEMGTIFYLRNIPLQDQFKVGIDVSWLDISWNNLDWGIKDPAIMRENSSIPYIFIGSKIGPVFSYNVIDELIIDAYYKLNPVLYVGGMVDFYDSDGTNYYTETDGGFGLRNALGINARYNMLMLGLELNMGTMSNYVYASTEGNGNSQSNNGSVETPMKTVRLTFGLKF